MAIKLVSAWRREHAAPAPGQHDASVRPKRASTHDEGRTGVGQINTLGRPFSKWALDESLLSCQECDGDASLAVNLHDEGCVEWPADFGGRQASVALSLKGGRHGD